MNRLPDRRAPLGRPPSAARRPPGFGGVRGFAVPPEIRRRTCDAQRTAPGAAAVANGIRLALGTAQRKLLLSRGKLLSNAGVLRGQLTARQRLISSR